MPTDNPFWQYSLALYGQDEVREICLRLQDASGYDVNLLLFCLWYGRRRGELGDTLLARAVAVSGEWQTVAVASLRAVRRQLKIWRPGLADSQSLDAAQESLREKVKELELSAEAYQQDLLFELAEASSPVGQAGADAMSGNLRRLSRLQGRNDVDTRGDLARLAELAIQAAAAD